MAGIRASVQSGITLRTICRLLAVPLLLLAGCVGEAEAPHRGRVLLLGLDGASPGLVTRLMERGRLPHLASLAAAGIHGRLRAHQPIWSPRIWNSISTGKPPEEHGIVGFVHDRVLFRSTDRRVRALWNIVSDADRTVAVVNWWNTHPPEEINGVVVTDHALPGVTVDRQLMFKAKRSSSGASVVFPPDWHERARAVLGDGEATPPAFFTQREGLPHWVKIEKLEDGYREDERLARLALEIEAELRPDLLMVLLPGIDRISHWLWGNLEPPEGFPPELRPSETERAAGRTALLDYYVAADQIIGRFLERYDEGDLVVVVSDHGFEGGPTLGRLTGRHETERAIHGLFYARGPGLAAGELARGRGRELSVDDVTPTVLAWLGLPVAEDMSGRPIANLDWDAADMLPTWDTKPIPWVVEEASGAEDVRLEELRQLGYVE